MADLSSTVLAEIAFFSVLVCSGQWMCSHIFKEDNLFLISNILVVFDNASSRTQIIFLAWYRIQEEST